MKDNIQKYIAGWCKGSTLGSAPRNLRSIRRPATILISIVFIISIFILAIPFASADSGSYGWYLMVDVSYNGTSWGNAYLVPLSEGIVNNAGQRSYWRIRGFSYYYNDMALIPGSWNVECKYSLVRYGNAQYSVDALFNFVSDDGFLQNMINSNYWDGRIRQSEYFYDSDTLIDSTPFSDEDFVALCKNGRFLSFVGQYGRNLSNNTSDIITPRIDAYFSSYPSCHMEVELPENNSSFLVTSYLYIQDVHIEYIPNYIRLFDVSLEASPILQRFETLFNQMVQQNYSATLAGIKSDTSAMVSSLDNIESDIGEMSAIESEHNAFQHEIQDQMEGAWGSYSSGASDGSDALEDMDVSSIGTYNPSVIPGAISSGGLFDWFTTTCHDSLRPPALKDDIQVVDFMTSWRNEFYSLLGGDDND